MKSLRCRFSLIFVVFVTLVLAPGCAYVSERVDSIREKPSAAPQPTVAATPENMHLIFGNPSNATAEPTNRDNYLLIKRNGVYSYNNSRGTANWVSWRTTSSDLGDNVPRSQFFPDEDLPAGFTRITTVDYIGSGYDRGHLIPSADRFADRSANAETFAMTNIIPQSAELNQYPWRKLESYSRRLVRRGYDLYTIAGVYGDKGRLRRKVTVPTNCWKIIVVLRGGETLADVDASTRVIAVDMPNTLGIRDNWWEMYRTSVRAIEEKTGYDFLSALPKELQVNLETRVDYGK